MAFRDLLLHIGTYPNPTSAAAIDQAVGLAKGIGGTLSALALTVAIPLRSNFAADALIGLSDMARDEEAKSREARSLDLEHFSTRAAGAGVCGEIITLQVDVFDIAAHAATAARTHDLSILPLGALPEEQDEVAQALIFDSGRPVLLFRAERGEPAAAPPHRVVVAWDGSRCSARAMGDALPILKLAKEVQLLTVKSPSHATGAPVLQAVRHLAAHGVKASVQEVEALGRSVGQVLEAELWERPAQLLVMGAYGHSRLRELVLGGASEHMIRLAPIPIFLSH